MQVLDVIWRDRCATRTESDRRLHCLNVAHDLAGGTVGVGWREESLCQATLGKSQAFDSR